MAMRTDKLCFHEPGILFLFLIFLYCVNIGLEHCRRGTGSYILIGSSRQEIDKEHFRRCFVMKNKTKYCDRVERVIDKKKVSE